MAASTPDQERGPAAAGLPPRARRLPTPVLLAIVVAGLGCDQATKRLAVARLVPGERISFLGDTLRLELARNPGAFLSLGASLPEGLRRNVFTYGAALIALGALGVALHRRSPPRTAVAAALVAAGGAGNVWDRIAHDGLVVDFLNAGVGGLRTGIFNVADVALMAGVGLLLLAPRRPRLEGGAG